jgi:hypothetical protein
MMSGGDINILTAREVRAGYRVPGTGDPLGVVWWAGVGG